LKLVLKKKLILKPCLNQTIILGLKLVLKYPNWWFEKKMHLDLKSNYLEHIWKSLWHELYWKLKNHIEHLRNNNLPHTNNREVNVNKKNQEKV